MTKAYIYTLVDPVTNEIRYVGKTVNLKARLSKHLYWSSLKNNKDYKSNWIKKLLRNKLVPIMNIVQKIDEKYWKECEIYWISYFKGIGCPLTNTDPGGLGMRRGYKPSKETIRKMVETRKKNGYIPSKETIKKGIDTRRKNGTIYKSKSVRKKMSIAAKSRSPISEETRKRLSKSHIGIKPTEDQNIKKSITMAKKKNINPVSGFKGVYWNKQRLKWRVRWGREHVGMFEDKIEAVKFYDLFLVDKFGKENCVTNKDMKLY